MDDPSPHSSAQTVAPGQLDTGRAPDTLPDDGKDAKAWPHTVQWQAGAAFPDSEVTCAGDISSAPETAGNLPASEKVSVTGYDILAELGRGGMGVVYKARQTTLKRLVALKMILAGVHAGPEELARFRSEAEAVARLQHPNLVQIYEVGEQEGRPYFSMEFVDGSNLARQLDGKPQSARQGALMVETLARAIHTAHQRGIVHRDLKPANVLLAADGTPKITDFGLAKRLDGDTQGQAATQSGSILGTPSYMSPEQAGSNKDIGPATDVYALGAILYEMLTGRPPFRAESGWDTILQVVSQEPVPPGRLQPKVPRDLETICLKCLEKEPRKRYPGADALADDLHRFLANEPILARPSGRWERTVKWARRRPTAAALVVVTVMATLSLIAGGLVYHVRLERALHESEARGEESRQRLVRLYVANGNHLMDQGDWLTALAWYTEALRLDEGEASREEMHRVRLATVLAQCPRPVQFWFHEGGVNRARFSPDGHRLVTASEDDTARVWDVATGRPLTPSLAHRGAVLDAEFSPDGREVVTASEDHTARVWDAATGLAIGPTLDPGHQVQVASFSPDRHSLLTLGADCPAQLWDRASGKRLPPPWGREATVSMALFSPDGRRLLTVSGDHSARVWDVATGKPVTQPLSHEGAILQAAFSPDGRKVVTASQDHTARLWDAITGQALAHPLRHAAPVNRALFSPDGHRVLTTARDNTARVWEADTGEPLSPPLVHGSDVKDAAFSPDGSQVVTASDDDTARVWDAVSGEALTPPLHHNGTVESAAFSPDGRFLITAGADGQVRLWNLTAARRFGQDAQDEPPKDTEASSPDHLRTIKIQGHTAQIVEKNTGASLGPLLKHSSHILQAAFSPDGLRVVTAGDDNTARIWNGLTGEMLTAPLRHSGSVLHAAFSPGGEKVVTASKDHTARVWDAMTGEPLTPPLRHPCVVECAWFRESGLEVVTSGSDQQFRRWDLHPDNRPAADLLLLAQLLAGGRIDARGEFLPLEPETLRTTWESLRTKYPDDFRNPKE